LVEQHISLYFVQTMKQIINIHHHHILPAGKLCWRVCN